MCRYDRRCSLRKVEILSKMFSELALVLSSVSWSNQSLLNAEHRSIETLLGVKHSACSSLGTKIDGLSSSCVNCWRRYLGSQTIQKTRNSRNKMHKSLNISWNLGEGLTPIKSVGILPCTKPSISGVMRRVHACEKTATNWFVTKQISMTLLPALLRGRYVSSEWNKHVKARRSKEQSHM